MLLQVGCSPSQRGETPAAEQSTSLCYHEAATQVNSNQGPHPGNHIYTVYGAHAIFDWQDLNNNERLAQTAAAERKQI